MTEVNGKKGLFVRSTRMDEDGSEKTQVSLYPGDTIEYKVSHEVELPDRTKMWCGFGSSTSVQGNETAQQAADRLVGFTHDQLKHRIVQAVQDAGDISL